MWSVQIGDKTFDCSRVEHMVRAGRAACLDVYSQRFEERTLHGFTRSEAVTLSDGDWGSATLELLAIARAPNGKAALRLGMPEKAELAPQGVDKLDSITVHQRRRSQSLTTLLEQVASPRTYAQIRQGMASADIEAAIPVGGCITTWSGESSALRSARGLAALARGSRVVVGEARAMADEAWRIVTFNPSDTDETMVLELPPTHWGLAAADRDSHQGWSLKYELFIENQWQLLETLMRSEETIVDVAEGVSVPVLPMTVRTCQTPVFASEVVATFDLTRKADRINTRFELRVTPDPKSEVTASEPRGLQPVVVLAQIVGPGTDKRLVEIEPATAPKGTAENLSCLPVWRSGDDKPLETIQPVPGYARENQAAIYSRWQKGDLVLVSLTEGNVPILLGAPRQRMDAYETPNGPDVVLHGARLRQIAEADDAASRTTLELGGDGRVAVEAPVQLDLTEGMVVKPASVAIQRDVAVTGNVDVS